MTKSFDNALKIALSQQKIDLSVIKTLLQNGANPNIRSNGDTIFEIAAKNNWSRDHYLNLIEMCVATKKLNANDLSDAYSYYISYAREFDFDIAKAFFDAGASPDKRSYNGDTILEIAAKNGWRPNSFKRIIKMVAKALPPKSIEESLDAEKILALLKSDKINEQEITALGKQSFAKERLIHYINTRPEEEKQEILHLVFQKNSNLHRFFSVQRGWFQTTMNRGSFITLNAMKTGSPGSNIFPLKPAQPQKAFQPSAKNLTFFKPENTQSKLLNGFICPITLEVMNEPVICTLDGKSYEKSAIIEWLTRSRSTPTQVKMPDAMLIEQVLVDNRNLAETIDNYKKEFPQLFLEDSQQQYTS